MRKTFPAYAASFASGLRQAMRSRADVFSMLLIYAVLLLVFNTVYAAMPVSELGVPGLTRHHLLWYFAVTESLICAQSLALFGSMISEGKLTEMMQRPVGIMGMFMARKLGTHIFSTGVLLAFSGVVLPLFFGANMTMEASLLPPLVLSLLLGMLIFDVLGYIVGTVEVLGPYSRPLGWIVSKFVFSLGGLFFPVSYFPPLLRHIVTLTPFPSVIGTPGEFMLMPDTGTMAKGILMQFFWLAASILLALVSERRMLRHVMDAGD
jgi:ABC-2 type transport system permease protein